MTSLPGEGPRRARYAPIRLEDETPETWGQMGPDEDDEDDDMGPLPACNCEGGDYGRTDPTDDRGSQ